MNPSTKKKSIAFLRGFFAPLSPPLPKRVARKARRNDADSLRSDWRKVGGDIKRSMDRLDQERTHS